MEPALAGDRGTAAEVRRDPLGCEGRRHHDQAQVGSNRLLQQPGDAEGQVAFEAAFVEFIEDQDADRFEERIVEEAAQQNAGRDHQQARVPAGLPIEAHVIADVAAEPPAALRGHPPRRGPHRESPRFEHDDLAVGR